MLGLLTFELFPLHHINIKKDSQENDRPPISFILPVLLPVFDQGHPDPGVRVRRRVRRKPENLFGEIRVDRKVLALVDQKRREENRAGDLHDDLVFDDPLHRVLLGDADDHPAPVQRLLDGRDVEEPLFEPENQARIFSLLRNRLRHQNNVLISISKGFGIAQLVAFKLLTHLP